eukprot:gene9125-biopygen12750
MKSWNFSRTQTLKLCIYEFSVADPAQGVAGRGGTNQPVGCAAALPRPFFVARRAFCVVDRDVAPVVAGPRPDVVEPVRGDEEDVAGMERRGEHVRPAEQRPAREVRGEEVDRRARRRPAPGNWRTRQRPRRLPPSPRARPA